MGQVDVFISYAWQGQSEDVAIEVEVRLKEKGLNIIRDKGFLGYKGSIKEFMQKIGKGKYVVLVISDRYLKSENCIYELLQIAKENSGSGKLFKRCKMLSKRERNPNIWISKAGKQEKKKSWRTTFLKKYNFSCTKL